MCSLLLLRKLPPKVVDEWYGITDFRPPPAVSEVPWLWYKVMICFNGSILYLPVLCHVRWWSSGPHFFLYQVFFILFQVALSQHGDISFSWLHVVPFWLPWQKYSCVFMPGLNPICRAGDLLQHVLLLMIIAVSCKPFEVSASIQAFPLPQGYTCVQTSHGVYCPVVSHAHHASAPLLGWGILLLQIAADSS